MIQVYENELRKIFEDVKDEETANTISHILIELNKIYKDRIVLKSFKVNSEGGSLNSLCSHDTLGLIKKLDEGKICKQKYSLIDFINQSNSYYSAFTKSELQNIKLYIQTYSSYNDIIKLYKIAKERIHKSITITYHLAFSKFIIKIGIHNDKLEIFFSSYGYNAIYHSIKLKI